MAPNRPRAATAADPHLIPPALAAWLSVFRSCFTAPVWNRVLVLVAGAVLAPGKRTVTQALRVMGLAEEPQFRRYHEVLSRARWDAKAVARRLLLHLLDRLLPDGPVVIGIDDTIERRWGAKIKARGIYRDPVRSSKGHFVKTSGLRWLSLMVVVPIRWSGRHWALPFLTVLAPSARWSEKHRKRHKTLTDWARQAILQTKRWLPNRLLIFVADSGFAALELLAAVRHRVCVITRLRLDAALYKPAPPRRKGQRGRTPLKGRRLPTLTRRAGQQEDCLDERGRLPMVQCPAAQAAGRDRHRGLVPRRHPAGADPLGAGARSDRRARAGRLPQHRPRRNRRR